MRWTRGYVWWRCWNFQFLERLVVIFHVNQLWIWTAADGRCLRSAGLAPQDSAAKLLQCRAGLGRSRFFGRPADVETPGEHSGKLTVCYWTWPIYGWVSYWQWWFPHSSVGLQEGTSRWTLAFGRKVQCFLCKLNGILTPHSSWAACFFYSESMFNDIDLALRGSWI